MNDSTHPSSPFRSASILERLLLVCLVQLQVVEVVGKSSSKRGVMDIYSAPIAGGQLALVRGGSPELRLWTEQYDHLNEKKAALEPAKMIDSDSRPGII